MASNARRGGGDRVLESRHLVGLFLSVVLLCGVFFTLGYVMGRTQYSGSVHASDTSLKSTPPPTAKTKDKDVEPPAAPPPGEWDFYANNANNNHLDPAPKSSPSTP